MPRIVEKCENISVVFQPLTKEVEFKKLEILKLNKYTVHLIKIQPYLISAFNIWSFEPDCNLSPDCSLSPENQL